MVTDKIDTTNKFFVGAHGNKLTVLAVEALARGITHDEALNLAAWLVTMAYTAEQDWDDLLRAVRNT